MNIYVLLPLYEYSILYTTRKVNIKPNLKKKRTAAGIDSSKNKQKIKHITKTFKLKEFVY